MGEVELWCGVYGEATVFPVEIACDAKVCALQQTIVNEKKDVNDRFKVDPAMLTLYLARKNGEWLTDDQNMERLLRGAVDTEYEKMRPSWKLKKEELLGENFEPGRREIHVLVKLPVAAVAVASEEPTIAQLAKKVHELHELIVPQKKRKRYDHSEMNTVKAHSLMRDLNIRMKVSRTVSSSDEDSPSIEPFKWESDEEEKEDEQRERYRAYVESNIGDVLANKRLCVLSVEKDSDILTVKVSDVELVGRADLLILSDVAKDDSSNLQWLPKVKMLIEVKRDMQDDAVYQALSELIALDALAGDSVMALVTDLTSHWHFLWISDKSKDRAFIRSAVLTDPSAAFEAIRTILAQESSDDSEISFPWIEEPVKRRKLTQLLPSLRGGVDIRGALERYRDIASISGPDIDLAREVANQIVRSMPAFSKYTFEH